MNVRSYHRGAQNQKSTFKPMHGVLFIGRKGASHCSVTYSVQLHTYIAFPIHSKHSLVMAMLKGGKILHMKINWCIGDLPFKF